MPFRYYDRLTRAQKHIYDQSDRITELRLWETDTLRPLVQVLSEALASEEPARVERACQHLLDGMARTLRVSPARVKVLAVRPRQHWGELHGLYTEARGPVPATINLWMRTARQRRVVAFRTFLRTLLHELCHHLDYRLMKLKDSFHTEGFYKRESSLFHQLVTAKEETALALPEGRPQEIAPSRVGR